MAPDWAMPLVFRCQRQLAIARFVGSARSGDRREIRPTYVPGIEGVTADRSWFRAGVDPARAPGQRRVDQAGPRDIWDVLEAAHHEWELADRPRWERYGLTAARGRTHFWLDEPSNVIVTPRSAL